MLRTALVSLTVLMTITNPVYCQTALVPNPVSPLPNQLTMQGAGDNAALTVHHDAIGRPCLDIEAASRSEVVNPDVYDHVVSVYNQCIATIKLRVCYYHTDHCIDMEIPGSQRKDAVLGIYPDMQYFRYSYEEKF